MRAKNERKMLLTFMQRKRILLGNKRTGHEPKRPCVPLHLHTVSWALPALRVTRARSTNLNANERPKGNRVYVA